MAVSTLESQHSELTELSSPASDDPLSSTSLSVSPSSCRGGNLSQSA